MAIDTFTWCVRTDASGSTNVATLQAQFGDGYKQVASAGINTAAETWNLTCSGKVAAMKPVREFLLSHVIKSFWWVNPWGKENSTGLRLILSVPHSRTVVLLKYLLCLSRPSRRKFPAPFDNRPLMRPFLWA